MSHAKNVSCVTLKTVLASVVQQTCEVDQFNALFKSDQ